jgi:ribosomal protein S18 acetylase RimI-like enzyme
MPGPAPAGGAGSGSGPGRGAQQVRVTEMISADWMAAYHYRGGAELPDIAQTLLAGVPGRTAFASVPDGGRTVAIGRGVVDPGWVGLAAIEVAPAHRRQGLAVAIVRALVGWGAERGARRVWLQVDDGNTAALALYRQLGFAVHHSYRYRVGPTV